MPPTRSELRWPDFQTHVRRNTTSSSSKHLKTVPAGCVELRTGWARGAGGYENVRGIAEKPRTFVECTRSRRDSSIR
jgi:hypothetical protein